MKIPDRILKFLLPALLLALPGGAVYLTAWLLWKLRTRRDPVVESKHDEDVSQRAGSDQGK